MAKPKVSVSSHEDNWLAEQRRKENRYSLKMQFDKTMRSITVEHSRACDADLVKQMHHESCDANQVANMSRSGTNSNTNANAPTRSVANVFLVLSIVFFWLAVVVFAISDADMSAGAPFITVGVIFMIVQSSIRKKLKK